MIGKQYKAHKDNVIDLFNAYKEKRGDINDGIDLERLEGLVKNLKNGKYTLAVAGEVNAGKSTFINALLGAEILPMDSRQASSAIIEIFKSDNSFVNVKYADGHKEDIYDDLSTPNIDEAREKLHEISRIHDKYRAIPTTLIDQYIKENKDLNISKSLIQKWEKQSKNNLEGQEGLLKQYISERTKAKIPVEINFGYPLKWDFDELRIVDSPGVNALGGVQDVSYNFFEDANSILFVHPIKPIESESFKEFVNSIISNRSKETLFLVLTHAGLYSNQDIEKLYAEAVRIYKDEIPKERILVLDSLLKLIHNDFLNGKTVKDIRKIEEKKMILASYREKAEDEDREIKDVVLEASRFKKMFQAIDKFSMEAPNLQLQEILTSIKSGYDDQGNQNKEKLELLNKKKRNPQEFEAEINRINTALTEYKLLTHNTKEDLTKNYTGKHSEWKKYIDQLKVKYPELITKSETFEVTRKNFRDGFNEIEDIISDFSKSLTKELSNRLKKSGKTFQEEHKITVPHIDLKSIEKKTKEDAYKKEPIYDTIIETFWEKGNWYKFNWTEKSRTKQVKTGDKSVYNDVKHLKSFKTECNDLFYELVNGLPSKSKEVLNKYMDSFQTEISSLIKSRHETLKKEKDKKQSNDEIISEISSLEEFKKKIQPEIKRIKEILENFL